jgi:hypothetical protein
MNIKKTVHHILNIPLPIRRQRSRSRNRIGRVIGRAVLDKHDIMDYTCIYNLYMHIKYVTTKQYTVQSLTCNMLSMVQVSHFFIQIQIECAYSY